jgi:hypothetical protein
MADLNYAHEKFGAAIRLLALDDQRLRGRLVKACAEALHFNPDAEHAGPEMDEALADLLRDFRERITSISGPEGAVTATISSLTDEEVSEVARTLLDLEYRLDEAWQERRWN